MTMIIYRNLKASYVGNGVFLSICGRLGNA